MGKVEARKTSRPVSRLFFSFWPLGLSFLLVLLVLPGSSGANGTQPPNGTLPLQNNTHNLTPPPQEPEAYIPVIVVNNRDEDFTHIEFYIQPENLNAILLDPFFPLLEAHTTAVTTLILQEASVEGILRMQAGYLTQDRSFNNKTESLLFSLDPSQHESGSQDDAPATEPEQSLFEEETIEKTTPLSKCLGESSIQGGGATQFEFDNCTLEFLANDGTEDVTITSIRFTPSNPLEAQTVTAQVNISNQGIANAENFTVRLNISHWNGTTWKWRDTSEQTHFRLLAGTTTSRNFTWSARAGTHRFTAFADALHNLSEANEANNQLATNLTVSSWHTFYGNIATGIVLANKNKNLTHWENKELGTLYVTDIDSPLNLAALRPLDDVGDLREVDEALNMTGHLDAVRKIYDRDADQSADEFANITVKGTPYETPVINSTNSTTFQTGILWDSTGGLTEYDGNQDLVFATPFNGTRKGMYGSYHYEIRVPSALKFQDGGTESVKLYVELR